MIKWKMFLIFLAGTLIFGLSACNKKFRITGSWNFYKNGSTDPINYEFSGTPEAGTVAIVGSNYGGGSYEVSGSQIIIKTSMVHGPMWSRTTYSGQIDEEKERMEGTYAGQVGGNPVTDFSGSWVASRAK
jgi:hypothetical protein